MSRCQPGFDRHHLKEWELAGYRPTSSGAGWLRLEAPAPADAGASSNTTFPEMVFSHAALLDPVECPGQSVNELAARLFAAFGNALRGERIDASWPLNWAAAADNPGLGKRLASVSGAFDTLLRGKLARVAKLATPAPPAALGLARGFFVFFTDFHRAWAARSAQFNGQHRMADDPGAPSRSYLKVEEAYRLLLREPAAGETVADLGAAPGGWSYSAARRGARVLAIDNGPLKGAALNHPNIDHRREDAFRFAPAPGERFDWLLCDLVEEPHHVVAHLLAPWIRERRCRRFIVNLKFGRVDPIAFLAELREATSPLAQAQNVRIRHLFHDREEFTVTGEVP